MLAHGESRGLAVTIPKPSRSLSDWKIVDSDVNGAFGYYQMVEKYLKVYEQVLRLEASKNAIDVS